MAQFDILGKLARYDWQDHSGDPGNLINSLVRPYVPLNEQQRFMTDGVWANPPPKAISAVPMPPQRQAGPWGPGAAQSYQSDMANSGNQTALPPQAQRLYPGGILGPLNILPYPLKGY